MQTIPSFPTRRLPRTRLLVFARVPELGLVKTRLAASIGDERALALYEAMLADLLDAIGPSDDRLQIEIVWTGSDTLDGDRVRKTFDGHLLSRQCGNTLGERLVVAFSERVVFHEDRKVLVIGADLPTLSRRDVDAAARLLDVCDWVVGPASDGGYYLLGCRGASFDPHVFQDIDWSSATVLASTLERIRSIGETVAMLPERRDIDTVEDLDAYAECETANATRLATLLEKWKT